MEQIKHYLGMMGPEDRITIAGMLVDLGLNENSNIDEVMPQLIAHAQEIKEGGLAVLVLSNIKNNAGKYAPKLSFGQRCEILGLYRKGCTRELLTKLYLVDRRTITHIYNPLSTHYKNVREEELRLGRDNFITKYVTDAVWQAALTYIGDKTESPANNKAANRKAGVHQMQNEYCERAHRVVIRWHEVDYNNNIQVAGWYYQDLDSEWPNEWFHTGPESMRTSQACFEGAQKDVAD